MTSGNHPQSLAKRLERMAIRVSGQPRAVIRRAVAEPPLPASPFDWQRYVPAPLRKMWLNLPVEARLAVYIASTQVAEDLSQSADDFGDTLPP